MNANTKHIIKIVLIGAATGLLLMPVAVWIGLEFLDGQHELFLTKTEGLQHV